MLLMLLEDPVFLERRLVLDFLAVLEHQLHPELQRLPLRPVVLDDLELQILLMDLVDL
jgi:hypothetical protein